MKNTILLILLLALGLVSVSLAAEDTWTTKANMPTARYIPSVGVVDGKIYVIGGTGGGPGYADVEEYDPATDTWTKKRDTSILRAGGAGSVVNGKVYVMGGRASLYGSNISSVQEYDPTADTWTTKANMLTARSWLSSSVVNCFDGGRIRSGNRHMDEEGRYAHCEGVSLHKRGEWKNLRYWWKSQ